MRLVFTAALLCAAATPALAQSAPQQTTRDKAAALAKALDNPMVQEAAAAMLSNLANIVLDTRVGPAAHYIDPTIGERDTLRDIQRRTDPDFDRRFHDGARRAVAAAGKLTEDGIAMQDSLEQTAARLKAALAPLRGALATK